MTAPWLFLLSLITGLALQFAWPLSIAEGSSGLIAGFLLTLAGLGIVLWSARVFRKMEISAEPDSRPSTFATGGPYRQSRNPMYLGLAVMHFGLALIINSAWLLVATIGVLLALDRTVIPREEALLAEMYPEEYARYRRRVRRWV